MEFLDDLAAQVGEKNFWVLETFLVIVLTLIVEILVHKVLQKLLTKAERTHNFWDDALIGAAIKPIRIFIWMLGVSIAADVVANNTASSILDMVPYVRKAAVIVLLVWSIVRIIRRAEENFIDPEFTNKPLDETTARAIGKLLRVSVVITGCLVLLQSLGYSISGVLAFGGVGGIAVGFAAKDLLANFFGGLMIYLDRPFSIGEWVRSPDQDIEGTVEHIGWRLTRIRTFDKRPLYIPNATFTQISVENPSRMSNRRIYETIGVRYSDANKMEEIITQVKAYLRSHADIDQNQTLIVNFNTFSASSLDFFVYTFTKTTDWVHFHEVKQDVLLGILKIIETCDAECAFPTSTLHVADAITLARQEPGC